MATAAGGAPKLYLAKAGISLATLVGLLSILALARAPGISNQAKLLQKEGVHTTGTILDRYVTNTRYTSTTTWKVRYTTVDGRTVVAVLSDCDQGVDGIEGDKIPLIYARSAPTQGRVGQSIDGCTKIATQYHLFAYVAAPIAVLLGAWSLIARRNAKQAAPAAPLKA
ncbi:MAG: hypothetical protein ACYDCC_15335 [Actinomycetota bacterium]